MRPVPLLCLCLALAPLAAPADAAPRRPGRVVRVERRRHVDPAPIHVCIVTSLPEGKLVCYGKEPAIGSTLSLVSESGPRGEAVVRSVAPSTMMDTCRTGSATDVTVEVTTSLPGDTPTPLGVQGITLEERARLLPQQTAVPNLPVADPGRVWQVLDRSGDGVGDMAIAGGDCRGEEALVTVSPDGRALTAFCLDYWLDDGQGYARAGRDIIYMCQ